MLKLVGIFGVISFLLSYAKNACLNMVTFRVPVLLLIKSWTLWYIECLPMSLYTRVIHF